MSDSKSVKQPLARRSGILAGTYRLMSNIWTGVTLLFLLFVYSTIGSALYDVRQMRFFELTEYQWFNWWPFTLLIFLIFISMMLASHRRGMFSRRLAGMWITHAGIWILIVGSLIYFGTKIEGDTFVIRRQLVIEAPGAQPTTLVALPGAKTAVKSPDGIYHFEVSSITPQWPLLSGPDKGKTAYSISLSVQGPNGNFIRQLLAGYPQYTEDIIPGKGRAVKSTGSKWVDQSLKVTLDYEPQSDFYIKDSTALYIREQGSEEWFRRPVKKMPQYNDYITSSRDIWINNGVMPDGIYPLDKTIKARQDNDDLPDVRITGFLRYARMQEALLDEGKELNPAISFELSSHNGKGMPYQLLAFDPALRSAEEGRLTFTWAENEDALQQKLQQRPGKLKFRIGDSQADLEFSTTHSLQVDPDLGFTDFPDSPYSYRLTAVYDDLPMSDGSAISVAVLEIKNGENTFTRWVNSDPAKIRDMPTHNDKSQHSTLPLDTGIDIQYTPGNNPGWINLVAGPDPMGLQVWVSSLEKPVRKLPLKIGERIDIGDGLFLTVNDFMPHAQAERRPVIIPKSQREKGAALYYSMLQVEVQTDQGPQSQWLHYNGYALKNSQYDYPGRFGLIPGYFTLADGRQIEMIYSRDSRKLPRPVVLDDFEITSHVGGFTGSGSSIRNWTSDLRFAEGEQWGEIQKLSVNDPVDVDGIWFFQATWDPAMEGSSQGQNYTGLGVGNRRGVLIQLIGCIISVIGMIYAFYGRALERRRRGQASIEKEEPLGIRPKRAPALVGVALGLLVLGAILSYGRGKSSGHKSIESSLFQQELDLSPLAQIAVYSEGRLKSFDSFANALMFYISGPRKVEGQPHTFTLLDMMFRPERYHDADTIYVKNKNIRAQIVQLLEPNQEVDRAWLERFPSVGLISNHNLTLPVVKSLLDRLAGDLVRTAKYVDAIRTSDALMRPELLANNMRFIPEPSGNLHSPWHAMQSLVISASAPQNPAHANLAMQIPGLSQEQQNGLLDAWQSLSEAWKKENAPEVNIALAQLGQILPTLNSQIYPNQQRLKWESWYFQHGNMTWVWLVYMLSVIGLLMAVVYRWPRARLVGMAFFTLAFSLHTFSLLLRWYVSDRWPNTNMFEAVTTAAWFGGCAAFILEWLGRRTAMRNLFALGSAGASMAALMSVHFLPLQLNPAIGNSMPVLHDIWLYIHTNVIIFSYCLIGMAAVTATLYLVWRAFGGGMDYARFGGAGTLAHAAGAEKRRASAGEVFDGATMVLMELSFVLLWAEIVMGAIWADHSWGRPWGWDPKEVFALNTFLVFVGLIHVRIKVRDKGLWTAFLALIGCGVMLFNWIVINFIISGLHSYA